MTVTALLGTSALGSLAPTAGAQERTGESLLQQQRVVDERLKRERSELAPLDSALDWQWGGWLDYYFFDFNDGVQSQRLLHRPSLFLWTRLSADDGAHEAFARMRLTFNSFEPGDEFERRQDWVGPNLDRGWYQMDIGKAFRIADSSSPVQAKVKIGRSEETFGTGYAFDQPLDAVTLDLKLWDFRINGLLGKSIGSYPNLDRSEPVDTHSARNFYGVQITYLGIDRHRPFAYALWNDDHTDERPKDYLQDYSYDSRYFGVGSRGEILHNLNYWGEGVFENGHSFGDGDFIRRDDIQAWGADVGLEYSWDRPARPRVAGEYMFASGDGERLFSATSARGGNYAGRDNAFNAFGYRDTGIALGASPSNLHIWKAGGSFLPLHRVEWLRELELGTNWFLYHKNQSAGAISDSTAQEFNGYVGWEMDYFVNWRVSADLSWTFRWGLFFPGDAYEDRSERSFFFTGLTWSF